MSQRAGMKSILTVVILLIINYQTIAQEGWVEESNSSSKLELTEGIYRTFEEFKNNTPGIVGEMELRSERLFAKDSSNEWIQIDADKVWACFVESKFYIAFEGRFWKSLNTGSLLHFAAIDYRTVVQANPMFGATASQEPVSVQLFLDTETGELMKLNYNNLKPYIEREPSLVDYVKKNRKSKSKQIILLLKAYNELNPLQLKTDE